MSRSVQQRTVHTARSTPEPGVPGGVESSRAMPNGSTRLYVHCIFGHGDVTRLPSIANVWLSWPMTRRMTITHVPRRGRRAFGAEHRGFSTHSESGAALACGGTHALASSQPDRVGRVDGRHQRRLRAGGNVLI